MSKLLTYLTANKQHKIGLMFVKDGTQKLST